MNAWASPSRCCCCVEMRQKPERTCTGLSAAGGVVGLCPAVGRLANVSKHLNLLALQTHCLEGLTQQQAGACNHCEQLS